MPAQPHDRLFSPLLKQLTVLFRQQLDISMLTLGGAVARGASSLLFWVIFALLSFFILLFLNIALAFALASWSESSPALGFLYLAGIYALLLLLLLLLRPILMRSVRNGVSRQSVAKIRYVNHRLDLIPYFREHRYHSPTRSMRDGGSYLLLEQARYQALLLHDKTWPEFVRTLTYISAHRHEIVSGYLRDEALSKVADIPLLGSLMQRLGYSPRSRSGVSARSGAKQASEDTAWYVRYAPSLLLLWEIFRPSITSMLLGQTQRMISGLFAGGRKRRK